MKWLRHTRRERGAALLEMALTLPLLLLVTVGIIEFGRAFQTWQVLTNAAREGARIAVLPGVDDAAVEARVQTYMDAGQLPRAMDANVEITRDNSISIGAGTASASRVTVNYPFEFIMLQPVARLVTNNANFGSVLMMAASAMMRNE